MELTEFMNAADALIERLAAKVDEQAMEFVRTTAYAGEWREAIDELIATLLTRRTPVTPNERDGLLRLLAYMKEPADRIDGLVVSGES